jgi:hypothetical protein
MGIELKEITPAYLMTTWSLCTKCISTTTYISLAATAEQTAASSSNLLKYRVLWGSFLDSRIKLPDNDQRRKGLSGQPGNVQFQTITFYVKHLANFAPWVQTQVGATQLDKDLTNGFSSLKTAFPVAILKEELKLKVGDWFLANPFFLLEDERSSMWFGHIRGIFIHKGPIGEILILKVRQVIS